MTGASILVVDDNPILLENLELALAAAGYDVATAGDGLAALEALQARPFDLVIADIALPRLDGWALCECARRDPRWAALPFLFLTGHELFAGSRASRRSEPCLHKPIQPEELLAAVQNRLRVDRPAGQPAAVGAR